jgi:hypothetical protein
MRMRWTVHVAHIEGAEHRTLIGKPEGKRPLGRLRCRRRNDIKMDFSEDQWRAGNYFEWLNNYPF